ncbi:cyclic pyranopterin phosphate synthase [Gillisia sp. Hel_I_86]|uniref:GTP 3',8-cyclase MoaA n=1 Tax=Gillisia sp. Hel_I_86 TaxID=1249981 RepID=UPI001199904D|nr:GTP 3',8-cyclase MoaA [Gillisia sp. Hel_I_86]TVZ27133.1 cyclic pyranopterin phosphate synthase [Gillisia sp. Hel_I_86]
MQLKDSFDRTIDYIRIGVTDRCNLRCFYCMPKEGIPYEPKADLLSYEEIIRLLDVLGNLGFKKVRFTGGEPFLRKDFITLLEKTHQLSHYKEIRITTNGTLMTQHIPKLKELGIDTINLSLDTLDAERFKEITRRDDFSKVIDAFHTLLDEGFTLKINAVVMNGINTEDILPLVALAEEHPVSIRFIEEMPFNGGYKENDTKFNATDIFDTIKNKYASLSAKTGKHGDTATNYTIDGFKGDVGIIAAFSRTFCNTCNRLRITPKGDIKTCLYDGGTFSIRDFIRSGVTDEQIANKFIELIKLKPENGFVAEEGIKKSPVRGESMSTIGG